jgi:3-hydroxybutyryl-CoA dehydrogenase
MSAATDTTVRRVAVVGPGRMGTLIALAYAFAGLRVDLVDLRDRAPEAARARRQAAMATIGDALGFLIEVGSAPPEAREATLARLGWADGARVDEVLAQADLAIEAVAEVPAEKAKVMARLDGAVRATCVIGSTTSTIAPDELAAMVRHPQRYLNVHWLNPAHVSPLVELQPCARTDPAWVEALRALHESMGKVPIVCGPSPGYLMPRLQLALMNEAARMVEEGVASAADIDRAVRWGLGVRYANMGVLEFVDWGGAEILSNAGRYMARATGAERFAPPAIVDRMIAEGRGGLRDGQGFHDWRGRDVPALQREVQRRIVERLREAGHLLRYDALTRGDAAGPSPADAAPPS